MLGKGNSAEGSIPASKNPRSRLGPCPNLNPFVCSLCSRAFPNAQALGGHQNAHRRVRNAAKGLSVEQRQARMKEIILTPISLRLVAVDEDQIFEHLELSSHSPSTELELGFGRGPKYAQGFKLAELGCCPSGPGSSMYGYGNPGGARHGKDKYHPSIKRRHQQVISCLELRLRTRVGQGAALGVSTVARDTNEYAKAFYGGEDGTEMTSRGKLDLTLTL